MAFLSFAKTVADSQLAKGSLRHVARIALLVVGHSREEHRQRFDIRVAQLFAERRALTRSAHVRHSQLAKHHGQRVQFGANLLVVELAVQVDIVILEFGVLVGGLLGTCAIERWRNHAALGRAVDIIEFGMGSAAKHARLTQAQQTVDQS